ncbi:hypothetical protein COU13_01650 [Candidatus Kaiserbacteria bacterium CG10_big_fil_rev_8_21_14_0_10_43_70]|uniref:Type II secretion system protein M n=1 Tax=Candidatus Kaiserbacteria bacterium CG10_big_fil_rev_8_21_14_0_10_43_70 TaxID=1974605 RepID=A0A2H0UIT2_9BACT|nr:MAG: hypothetical protein COU13_01650 [Candidatus Kaiserbacteria bacterium CG10_big_fil_rev_8_21_14_0_10_43_70]
MKANRNFFKMILAGVFAAAMTAVFTFTVLKINDESRLRDIAIKSQAQSSARDAYGGSLRILARDTSTSRLKLDAITSERDIVTLIQFLEEAGDVSGANVSVDAVSSGESEDALQSAIVLISASGSFDEIIHLLSIVESLPAASSINQFEIQKGEKGGDEWNIQVRVRFLVEGF